MAGGKGRLKSLSSGAKLCHARGEGQWQSIGATNGVVRLIVNIVKPDDGEPFAAQRVEGIADYDFAWIGSMGSMSPSCSNG
jgi:hypothetical protein